MKLHRLTLKDWIVNLYLRHRFNNIRKNNPKLLSNYSAPHKKGYKLTFNDDFDKVSWEGEDRLWDIGEPWGPFHPSWLNKYFGLPEHIPNTSFAKFFAKYAPKKFMLDHKEIEIPYVCSWLNTEKTFTQQYGRFECRMTLPKEKGSWPAFWLWGPTWPPEIDVVEAYGRDTGEDIVYQEICVHWELEGEKSKSSRGWKIKIDDYDENISERFHEFAVEWDKTGLYFYTDGIKVFQYTNKKILDAEFNPEGVKPWMLVNQNIFKFIDGSEGDKYYSEFKVDYIRAYKKI